MKTKNQPGPLIVKANELVEASYRLTLQEQRLILYMASLIRPEADDLKLYRITVSELAGAVGVKESNLFPAVKAIIKPLLSKTLVIRERGKNSTLLVNWLASAEYYEKQGTVEVEFSQKLKPYLLQLRERFTTLQRQHVVRMTSTYAIRIYMLLKQYQAVGRRRFPLDELRGILGINPDEYPLYGHFKARVLAHAQKELSRHADIFFEVEEHKNVRKVIAVTLHVSTNIPETLAVNALARRLQQYFLLTPDQAVAILQSYEEERIGAALDYTEHQIRAGKVENLAAFTQAAIKNGWRRQQSLFEAEQRDKGKNARLLEEEARTREKRSHAYQEWYRTEIERLMAAYPDKRLAALTDQARALTIEEHGAGVGLSIMTKLRLARIIAEEHRVLSQEEWEAVTATGNGNPARHGGNTPVTRPKISP